MNSRIVSIAVVGVLAVSLALSALLLMTGSQPRSTAPESVAPTVRTQLAEPSRVRMLVHSQGTVAPRTEVDLIPEISGTVLWVSPNLVPGGYFEQGDLLLRIDDRDYRDAAQRARAAINRAEAEHEHARLELRRIERLHDQALISSAELEAAKRTARVAEAQREDVEIALQQAERDHSRIELTAPFAGLVRSEQVDPGQFVSRGAPVARLYAVDYVEVRLPIADRQLAYLDLPPLYRGELEESSAPSVVLSAEFAGQDFRWHGKLARTEAAIDTSSGMVYAVARVNVGGEAGEDAKRLPPPVGLFVQAEIQGRSADDIVVLPRSAIRGENEVLVVEDGRLRFRTVSIARIYGDEVYIDGGLLHGERVSISALRTATDGMRVEVVSEDTLNAVPR